MSVSSSQRMLSLWLRRLSTDRIARLRDAEMRPLAPSPRANSGLPEFANTDWPKSETSDFGWREGRGEGAFRQAQTRDDDPSPACRRCAPTGDLSPQAGRGERALVVTGKRGNVELLTAVDEAAEQLGLKPGLTLAQARAMHPGIEAVAEDTESDSALLESIADWCLRYTPLVACDAPDGLLLDISGCTHLYGGERALIADLSGRLDKAGFAYSLAIAGTIGAAWAAAHYGEPTSHVSGEERALLAPLPLSALRIPSVTAASLARVGLKRIGDILDLPRAPLTARFGSDVLRQLDRALAHEHEPLTPRLPVAPYVAEQRFAEPIAREEDVLAVTGRLARRLQFALERRGDGARRIELTLFRTDGMVRRIAAGTSRPLRDPDEIRGLFVERLAALADAFDPGFGFDMARLSVIVVEPSPPQQIGIGGGEDEAELCRLIDRLSARLGARRVQRLAAQDSHIPEVAEAALPAQAVNGDAGWTAFRRYREEAALSPRPLRLLTRPEPIEAVAEVPDGPPLRFRWRRALHEVVAAEGPERIEGAWWSEHGGQISGNLARDYFRVEDKSGLRFWLFRAGLYRNLVPGDPAPTWFLHGTFA